MKSAYAGGLRSPRGGPDVGARRTARRLSRQHSFGASSTQPPQHQQRTPRHSEPLEIPNRRCDGPAKVLRPASRLGRRASRGRSATQVGRTGAEAKQVSRKQPRSSDRVRGCWFGTKRPSPKVRRRMTFSLRAPLTLQRPISSSHFSCVLHVQETLLSGHARHASSPAGHALPQRVHPQLRASAVPHSSVLPLAVRSARRLTPAPAMLHSTSPRQSRPDAHLSNASRAHARTFSRSRTAS